MVTTMHATGLPATRHCQVGWLGPCRPLYRCGASTSELQAAACAVALQAQLLDAPESLKLARVHSPSFDNLLCSDAKIRKDCLSAVAHSVVLTLAAGLSSLVQLLQVAHKHSERDQLLPPFMDEQKS